MLSLVVNLAVLSFMLFIFTMSIYFLVFLKIENSKLKLQNIQLTSDMFASLAFMSDKINQDPSIEVQASEDFLKFVSDSRDSAYAYIENVQSVLNKFISDVEPVINYNKKYGDVVPIEPYTSQLKAISVAFEELKQLLPSPELG